MFALDLAAWPLVAMTTTGEVTEDETNAYLAAFDQCLDQGEDFAVVLDYRGVTGSSTLLAPGSRRSPTWWRASGTYSLAACRSVTTNRKMMAPSATSENIHRSLRGSGARDDLVDRAVDSPERNQREKRGDGGEKSGHEESTKRGRGEAEQRRHTGRDGHVRCRRRRLIRKLPGAGRHRHGRARQRSSQRRHHLPPMRRVA